MKLPDLGSSLFDDLPKLTENFAPGQLIGLHSLIGLYEDVKIDQLIGTNKLNKLYRALLYNKIDSDWAIMCIRAGFGLPERSAGPAATACPASSRPTLGCAHQQ